MSGMVDGPKAITIGLLRYLLVECLSGEQRYLVNPLLSCDYIMFML